MFSEINISAWDYFMKYEPLIGDSLGMFCGTSTKGSTKKKKLSLVNPK